MITLLGLHQYARLEEIVALCEKSGVHTKFIPDYTNIIPTKPYTEDLLGLPVINIRYVPLTNTFSAAVKRAMDIFGAIVAIILFSPVMLIFAVLIKATSKVPPPRKNTGWGFTISLLRCKNSVLWKCSRRRRSERPGR